MIPFTNVLQCTKQKNTPLQPNKRIGTVIPFHLHLFL